MAKSPNRLTDAGQQQNIQRLPAIETNQSQRELVWLLMIDYVICEVVGYEKLRHIKRYLRGRPFHAPQRRAETLGRAVLGPDSLLLDEGRVEL